MGAVAIYPGTFDPVTNGHYDVIRKGSRLFDQLIVAVGYNRGKKTHLDLKTRIRLLQTVCSGLDNVRVASFTGLVVAFARQNHAKVLLRGLRTEADFAYEMQMAMMNSSLNDDIQTVFLPTKQSYSHISSSLVKSVAELGGDISSLVPAGVAHFLTSELSCPMTGQEEKKP